MPATNHIGIRLTERQRARLEDAADHAGQPLSVWVRTVALAVAGDEAAEALLSDIQRACNLRSVKVP